MAPAVTWLRSYRDRHLLGNEGGRALVDLYYRVGPNAAAVIADRPWLRAVARFLLLPLVLLALLTLALPTWGPLAFGAGAWLSARAVRRKHKGGGEA